MDVFPSSQTSVQSQMRQPGFQSMEQGMSRPKEAESAVTLLIRHLPEAIPHDTLSRLFSHYGASSVRPCSSGRLRNCAFVDFKNEAVACQAQHQLNGLRFLGKVLKVERAGNTTENNKPQKGEAQPLSSTMMDTKVAQQSEGLKRGQSLTGEPIAPRLGIDYPFPPHLEYAYPPPDGNILTNIVNALIAVPRFYTQVLHLMNKMNLPAPFRMALPTPPLPPSVPAQPLSQPQPPPPPPPLNAVPQVPASSSDESEMESSDEEAHDRSNTAAASEASESRRKRVKRESIVGPAVNKEVAHEAVGLKPSILTPKEIPKIRTNAPVLKIKIAPKSVQNEIKDENIRRDSEETNEENQDFKPYATIEEINNGRLPPEEILSLPMFKNYTAGNPSSVLYIKNLAKDVVTDDFYFIFGSLFGGVDEAKSGLSVRLMQEGRMRGQAFVTFPSIELAQGALNLVNGYVFKGKPMIIQFGRNPAPSKTN